MYTLKSRAVDHELWKMQCELSCSGQVSRNSVVALLTSSGTFTEEDELLQLKIIYSIAPLVFSHNT